MRTVKIDGFKCLAPASDEARAVRAMCAEFSTDEIAEALCLAEFIVFNTIRVMRERARKREAICA